MSACGQACPYNTLFGCKVEMLGGVCPLYNMAYKATNKPQTNADRIRAMSDEELAEAIMSGAYCNSECPPDAGCHDCCFAWLKQPVKDGEGDG